jgi:carbamoyltransferase
VDNTCRVQTVSKEDNEHYYNLINAFNDKTGVPILFNTSFNLAGDPLVETLLDAIDTLERSEINYLYLPEIKKLILKKKIKKQ